MQENNRMNWKKYGFEFLLIFTAVISAFALNNWNENRRDHNSQIKILTEIYNGLEKDLIDIRTNISGHKKGIQACEVFNRAIAGQEFIKDSLYLYYFVITRDFITVQNIAGYETLKSKGLELIENDSIRYEIISLYEYDYNTLRKFEEEYYEMQFEKNYFKELNTAISPNFITNAEGNLAGIKSPLEIPENERKKILWYLVKIKTNREFILKYYTDIELKVQAIREKINKEIKS